MTARSASVGSYNEMSHFLAIPLISHFRDRMAW